MKVRRDNGSYKVFSPIKYDVSYRYKKTKDDLKREAMLQLLESITDDISFN